MISIGTGDSIEARQFMDDEHQITIGIEGGLWPLVQRLANSTAANKQWLGGRGNERDYLNIWIIGRVARCPKGIEAHAWIAQAVT